MTEINDPYKAPEAELSELHNSDKINAFSRFSTWGVIGLTIITLGFYVYYWMFTRARILNSLIPQNPTPGWMLPTLIVLNVGSTAFNFWIMRAGMGSEVIYLSQIFGVITFSVALIWLFSFKSRLNIITESKKGDANWVSPILTFLVFTICNIRSIGYMMECIEK